LTAPNAILAEWSRTDATYAQRVNHLHGSSSGGLNGHYFLKPRTLTFGPSPDTLNGGPGMDWFWANTAIVGSRAIVRVSGSIDRLHR
jgi:hypothetical protein